MSHVHEGPLATYNSLTDPNLSGYFGNTRMRRHLRKAGLVNRRGQIVSENQYRLNMARKEHKKHVKDLLAQAIVHKTLDLERFRQVEIKKKLEEIAKIELVRRVRATRGRKGDEDVLPYLSPRSHSRPQSGKTSEASSRRPKSAPAPPRNRQYKSGYTDPYEDVIYVDDDGRPVSPPPPSDRQSFKDSLKDVRPENIDTRHLYALDSEALQQYALRLSKAERGRDGASSPYLLSQIPQPPKRERARSARSPRRSARMSARPDSSRKHGVRGALMLHRQEPAMMHQGEVQTLCEITMKYHGPNLTLPRDQFDPTQEVSIEQQHCGGNTLPVFKERLQAGSTFSFISRRHRGYPFSLTLFIDGRVDCRVSTCCEYKHGIGVKLGGKMGHFSLTGITGATPCYKCKLSCQAPPRSLKLKKGKGYSAKKKKDTGEEVTVEGTPRTPITQKNEEQAKSDEDNYDDDFEEDNSKGNKYEDDFEEEADDQDRRHIIGLHDDETRENGKTVSVDVTEKEKEQEKEGTLPEHRRVEGYSSEDEDAEGPRSKSIDVTADVHSQKKGDSPKRRRRSSSSSSSSSSSLERDTPRPQTPERKTRSPEPAKVIEATVEVHSDRSEPPKSGRSIASTTSGSLTTETESTLESNRKPLEPVPPPRRRTSSSSSSSTLSSDSEDEKYQKKKEEKRQRMENEKRRKEEEERRKKEADKRERQRKQQLEEDDRKRMEAEEERKKRFELQRQQSQDRLRMMEEQRKKQELERQEQLSEQMKAKEEERQRRLAEEERIKKDYEKQLSFIQSQRESESTLSVTDTTVSEEPKVEVRKETEVKPEKRKSSTSSSSSESDSEDEEKKKSTVTSSPFQAALESLKTEEPVQEEKRPAVTSSSSATGSTSGSDTEKEKAKEPPVQPIPTISEEKKKESRRSSTSSASSTSSSSSDGEYTIDKDLKPGQKKDEEIKEVIKKTEEEEPVKISESPGAKGKRSSSSSESSSGSESDEDNKKVAETKEVEVKKQAVEAVSTEKPKAEKKSSSSSTSSSSYSPSESESDAEFKPPEKPVEPAPFGGIQREPTFETEDFTIERTKFSPQPPAMASITKKEAKIVMAQKEESEDSSSDSSSSDSDSSDSEEEKETSPKKEGSKSVTSESEPETMHGGHDPDNVAKSGKSVESHLAKSIVQPPVTHFGSILPMIKGSYAIDLNGVKLDDSQMTEVNNYIAEVENIKSLTLRNCALNDSSFQNLALALQVTQSSPNLLNFSLNQLGAKSVSPLAVAIKNKPSIEIVILNGNPIGNVGCKVLMDALVKTEDPFPFLRRGSGYLTPSEARKQREEGKEVEYDDRTKITGCNIKELDLGDTKISDAGIAEIARFLESNKTLVSLNLNGNRQISPTGWERLGQAMKTNKTLKTLSLDYTDIGDAGIENLAKSLRVNTGLRSLELESSGLTEKGGEILRDLLKSNTCILEVTVSPGNSISDGMLEEIRKYLALNNSASSK